MLGLVLLPPRANNRRTSFDVSPATCPCKTCCNRPVFNVNAHDKVCARIDGCLAAPLPDPDSLPPLPPIVLPTPRAGRYAQWAAGAKNLADDCDRLIAHLGTVREGIAVRRAGAPTRWNATEVVDDLAWDKVGISAGNRMAFAYFLRSAIHNVNADMHWRRRTANAAHANWLMLGSLDQAAQALVNAAGKLKADMEVIRREL